MNKFSGAVVHFFIDCTRAVQHTPIIAVVGFAAVAGLAVLVWRMGR